MSTSKKYVCPDCGGNLSWYNNAEITRAINPKTGAISKKHNIEEGLADGVYGVTCSKCTWSINTFSDDLPKNLEALNQIANKFCNQNPK